ncbi:MAG: hypothetical protein Q7S82_02025, partial [bacterium]|nr:hypothetical protein [bacterium]
MVQSAWSNLPALVIDGRPKNGTLAVEVFKMLTVEMQMSNFAWPRTLLNQATVWEESLTIVVQNHFFRQFQFLLNQLFGLVFDAVMTRDGW